jgi:elongation factor 2
VLQENFSGRAFSQMVFDHWDIVIGDPYDGESIGGKLVQAIRERKGLKPGIPALENFID